MVSLFNWAFQLWGKQLKHSVVEGRTAIAEEGTIEKEARVQVGIACCRVGSPRIHPFAVANYRY